MTASSRTVAPARPAPAAVDPMPAEDAAVHAAIDFTVPADVFWSSSARRLTRHGSMRFKSFETLAEAIRFVVDDKSEPRFRCAVDTADDRYEDGAIEALYGCGDFPPGPDAAPPGVPPVAASAAYGLRHEERGTWTVYEVRTGEAVVVNGVLMTRMGLAEAGNMARALNGPDRQDMLAMGP